MMILGIDTATSTGAMGVYHEEEGVLGELSFRVDRGHGRILNPLLAQLFSHIKLDVKDLKGIVVGLGPGSFTGTRVGITLARSLTLALDIPIWGLSTLEALAINCPQGQPILSLLDARNERVYWGLYSWEEYRPIPLIKDRAGNIEDIGPEIEAYCANLVVVGEYPNSYLKTLEKKFPGTISMPPVFNNQLRGGAIAHAGFLRYKDNPEGENLERIVPRYMKKAV